MGLVRTTAPAVEPLSLDEAKTHLRLGATNLEPVPVAPAVALVAATPGNVNNGAHRYKITFVTADGETDGGITSEAVTVVDKTVAGKISVALPLGSSRVTARKIYRTAAAGTDFLLVVGVADNTTTSYLDNIADASLGAGCPTSNSTDDTELRSLIASAREIAEEDLRRALITQTWTLTLDEFPANGRIRLPKPNLISVTSVKYLDESGTQVTLATSVYGVDAASLPGEIYLKYAQIWPFVLCQRSAIEIVFVCGYGATAAAVPEAIKAGMKLIIGDLYENRESVNIGNIVNDLPALGNLFGLHRYVEMA